MGEGDGGAVAEPMVVKVYVNGPEPLDIVYVVPRPDHVAPFQPSPHESVAVIWQTVPDRTGAMPVKGLPPESVVPSAHESTQPTSPGYMPPDTVIVPGGGGGGGTVTEAMKVCVNGPEPLAIE